MDGLFFARCEQLAFHRGVEVRDRSRRSSCGRRSRLDISGAPILLRFRTTHSRRVAHAARTAMLSGLLNRNSSAVFDRPRPSISCMISINWAAALRRDRYQRAMDGGMFCQTLFSPQHSYSAMARHFSDALPFYTSGRARILTSNVSQAQLASQLIEAGNEAST